MRDKTGFLIAYIMMFLGGCHVTSLSSPDAASGKKPEGIENQLTIPLIKYQRHYKDPTDAKTKHCPEGQAFFSLCGANRISKSLAVTARHCIVREDLDTEVLEPSDVIWFPDHVKMHQVLHKREMCLDVADTVAQLTSEVVGGVVVPKSQILSPEKDGKLVEFPDFAFIRDVRFQKTAFEILPLLDPDGLTPGTRVTKIGFGAVGCSKELSPELKQKYDGYQYQYDRHNISHYGATVTYARLLDKKSMEEYSPKNAKKRDFDNYIYYLAGEDGMYSCLSDSSATLVEQDGQHYIVGAHRGGVTIYDESENTPRKTPTPFKLEIAAKVSGPEVCAFVQTIPEAWEHFVDICK